MRFGKAESVPLVKPFLREEISTGAMVATTCRFTTCVLTTCMVTRFSGMLGLKVTRFSGMFMFTGDPFQRGKLPWITVSCGRSQDSYRMAARSERRCGRGTGGRGLFCDLEARRSNSGLGRQEGQHTLGRFVVQTRPCGLDLAQLA